MPPTLLRPLAFGELLDGAFTLYRRHFLTFLVTSLAGMVAINGLMMPALLVMSGSDPEDSTLPLMLLVVWPVVMLVSLALWAALTRQAACAIEGRATTVRDGYRHGFRSFLPLLGAGILILLLALVLAVPASLVFGLIVFGLVMAVGEVGGAVLTALLGLLFYALLLGAFAMLFAVPAAVVVERKGPWSAILRSWSLAKGDRWRVAGTVLVSTLIVALPSFALLGMVFASGITDMSPGAPPDATWIWIQTVGNAVIGSLMYPFWVVAVTLLYFDRRVRTEAYDLERATEALAPAP